MTYTVNQPQSSAVEAMLGAIAHGYAAAARTADGWLAGVILIHNADDEFVEKMEWADNSGVVLRPGRTLEQWAQAVRNTQRRVLWWTGDENASSSPRKLAAADRVFGVAAAGPQPAVAWCQGDAGVWALKVLIDAPPPPWLQGRSLAPLVSGERTQIREEIFAELNYHAAYQPMRCIRTTRWKYIRRFYDRATPIQPNQDLSTRNQVHEV